MHKRILLIDDSKPFQKLVLECLPEWTFRTAQTLADGVRLLQEEAPDVILCDLGLPDAQGFHAIDVIVPMVQRLPSPVPVVVVTDADVEKWGTEITNRGANGLLLKRGQGPELLRDQLLTAILVPHGHLAYLRRQGALASLDGVYRIEVLTNLMDERLSPDACDGLKALPRILEVLETRLPPPTPPADPGAPGAAMPAPAPAASPGFFASLRAAWKDAPLTTKSGISGGLLTLGAIVGVYLKQWWAGLNPGG